MNEHREEHAGERVLILMGNGYRLAIAVLLTAWILKLPASAQDPTTLLAPTQAAPTDQDTQPPTDSPPPSNNGAPDSLTTLRNRVTQSQLPDEEKKSLIEAISQAEASLAGAASSEKSAAEYQASLDSIPERTEKAKEQLKGLVDFEPSVEADATLEALEAMLPQLSSQLATAKNDLSKAETSTSLASKRRQEIETDITTIEQQLSEIRSQIESSPTAPSSIQEEIQRETLLASEKQQTAQLAALRNEEALIDAETAAGSAQLDRDLQSRIVETLQEQIDAVQGAIAAKRAEDAAERVESAESQLADLHPALRPIGEQAQQYAADNQELASKIAEAEQDLRKQTEMLDGIRQEFQSAKTRVDSVGLTEAVGSQLRTLGASLPNAREYQLRLSERQPEINDAQYTLIELTDRRNMRTSQMIRSLFVNAEPPVPFLEQEELTREARELIARQRNEYLNPLIRSQTTYFNTLVALSTVEQQIIDLVTEANEYVKQRVLWVRSTRPLIRDPLPNENEWWFLLPGTWNSIGPRLLGDLTRRWLRWTLAALALAGLVHYRFRLRHELESIGQTVQRGSFTEFKPTLNALVITLATAGPVTLAMGFLGTRLRFVAGVDPASLGISNALIAGAMLYFPLEVFRQILRPNGLAIAHFGRHPDSMSRLRSWLGRLMWIMLPLVMWTTFLRSGGYGFGNDILQRYFFLAGTIVLAVMIGRLMHPRKGMPAYYLATHPGGWASRLSYVWYFGLIALPLAVGILATGGYYFTATQLGWRLYQTIVLVLVAGLLVFLITRWVLLRRREFMIAEARAKREQELAASEEPESEIPVAPTEDAAEELRQQMEQTKRLLATIMATVVVIGLWMVWSDVLTAREQLEQYPLWQSTSTETEMKVNPQGEAVTVTKTVVDNITIADVLFAVLIIAITILAFRNIPGLLEFAVLKKLPLDSSIRYAISSLASYAIALIGLVISGQAIGLHWGQIQWMATALTFGLAFGLQEMFANFVAGVIILFEQPVRVGDVVEIDGVTGVVSRIRIRATTITDWNRKDYIVPNKEFITGKILNWTRSDTTNRIVIPIGIAYGSDTEKARELLIQTAADQEFILEDPGPSATFEGFGDNALNFVLRCFVGTMSVRMGTTHDLHTAIDQAFRKAGIEISFPQRDLYLRGIPDSMQTYFNSKDATGSTDT